MKVAFEFYIKWCESGCNSSILFKCTTVNYLSTKQSKYSNCTVTSSKYLEENHRYTARHAQFIILSGLYAIITAHDSMQNPGQTQIFYKTGQTCLTWTKHDLVGLDDHTHFQPWHSVQLYFTVTALYMKFTNCLINTYLSSQMDKQVPLLKGGHVHI